MEDTNMDAYDMSTFDMRPYWDLYASADLVLLAYHCCEPGQKPVAARYDHTDKEYVCPNCGEKHPTRITVTDHLLAPLIDKGYYVGE